MIPISVKFDSRDFSDYPMKHWERIQVVKYSKAAIGGCKKAEIHAYGAEDDMWQFINMLRCGVTIIDDSRSKPVWWGYIAKIEIYSPAGLQYGLELDGMSNKLAIAYTIDFERETTTWASDSDSVTEYGTKEMLISTNDKTPDQANQYRDAELDARKYPAPIGLKWGKRIPQAMVKIYCLGWLSTLAWRYYDQDAGRVAYEEINTWQGRELGEDDQPICAQSFVSNASQNWTATHIWSRHRWVGNQFSSPPTDDVTSYLYSNTNSRPGTLLRSTQNIGTAEGITEYHQWFEFEMASSYPIVTGTKYWIVWKRTGATDIDRYWMVGGNSGESYIDGELKLLKGVTWSLWDQPGDLNFRVVGEEETTDQIITMINNVGDLLEGVNIISQSGQKSSPYRNGDSLALYELEELLRVGSITNRRLLIDIDHNRIANVATEPAIWSQDVTIDGKGKLYNRYGNEIVKQRCLHGYWGRLKEVIPQQIDVTKLTNVTKFFVEEAEYNVLKDQYRILKTRDSLTPYENITIREG